jgi:hypothetical protein
MRFTVIRWAAETTCYHYTLSLPPHKSADLNYFAAEASNHARIQYFLFFF